MQKYIGFLMLLFLFLNELKAQEVKFIQKIPESVLAGEGLDTIPQKDSTRTFYQKVVYNGQDLAIYMVAIGTGITNEFRSFPMEEFIFWKNGKALVEPAGEESFEIQSGDYFIQAKGFNGKWNFIDINGGLHLELALVAKNRPDTSIKSPISRAIVLENDLLSGVIPFVDKKEIYKGVELTVNILNSKSITYNASSQERMLHIINGILTYNPKGAEPQYYYPGDFMIIQEGFDGTLYSSGQQQIRLLEVYKTKS